MKKEELILSLDGNSHYKQMALELAEKKRGSGVCGEVCEEGAVQPEV